MLNATHDPDLRSWVASANEPGAAFPIQNLPFGEIRPRGSGDPFRAGLAIGDCALDLAALSRTGIVKGFVADVLHLCEAPTLNALMDQPTDARSALRSTLSQLLCDGSPAMASVQSCLIPLETLEFDVPARIGDYTDFYASIHHATNVGRLFRPENPLLPNYPWLPVGYHGRSSSVIVSGQAIRRPVGQLRAPDRDEPVLAPTRRLDYELEVGIFMGPGNRQGEPIRIADAGDHLFGLCLLNDWSARDIQSWEYQPLGPFLAKNFASTISPWIVTVEALAPFRTPWSRPPDHPQPLAYLDDEANSARGAFDVQLEVLLQTEGMRRARQAPVLLSQSNFAESYWTVAQMVAHHTVTGCNLRAGDLFGSGTMSGAVNGSEGALIELTQGGRRPLRLPNGETRTFLEDGDTVIMRGWCERAGAIPIGFGEVAGTVLPAHV